tara:strand:+ start:814 stop:1164 length:351 start_codon:yes stop_codon:yes gene_type:complete
MINILKNLLILFFLVAILLPYKAISAEILQISSATLLQIGDQNRSYSVQLSCLEIEPSFKQEAKDWLKSTFPRHTKVNLRPTGSEEGILFAKVITLGNKEDISDLLIKKGFAQSTC